MHHFPYDVQECTLKLGSWTYDGSVVRVLSYKSHNATRGSFLERFFHRKSNSMEISSRSHPSCKQAIALKFCTWHDICAVVACANFWSVIIPFNGVTSKPSFHRILITMEKSFVKWAISPMSHNAPFCKVHTCAHLCDKMVHCGMLDALLDLWEGSTSSHN